MRIPVVCACLLVGVWMGCQTQTSSDGEATRSEAAPGPRTQGETTQGETTQDAASEPARFPIEQNGQWGYINRTGTVVIVPKFDRAWRFADGRALVRQNGRFGFIDTTGTTVITPRFSDAWHFSDGLAPVQTDSLWGFVNPVGEMVVDAQFDLAPGTATAASTGSPALTRAQVNGRYGFRRGDSLVIAPQYDQAWTFSEGLARVQTGGRWGYIDRSGTLAIEPRFLQAWDFQNGLARVRLPDSTLAYVNRQGTVVWPEQPSSGGGHDS